MKNEFEKEFNRLELAEQLEKIARQLRQGTYDTEGRQWSVPETVVAKIKHKEKKGRIETKLKWRWSTLAEYEPSAREEVTRWQESFKTVKKRLAKEFQALQSQVQKGSIPNSENLAAFVKDSERMAEFAEPEWQGAMNEYMDHLENLKRAVDRRQLDDAAHELRDLRTRWKECHRDFK
jgi:XXXCH domain-containing protein